VFAFPEKRRLRSDNSEASKSGAIGKVVLHYLHLEDDKPTA
jgi:hypothetical protein